MRLCTKDGIEMMHMQSISREGEGLLVVGKVMGSMKMSVFVRPEDLWEGRSLLTWSVICYLPIMLAKGIWRAMFKKKK